MKNIEILPDFITNYFVFEGNQYKMAAVPEMVPTNAGLDFTGNFIGIHIVAKNGTMTFERDQHPDKFWTCDKQPLENAPEDFPNHFTFRSFEYEDNPYKVALTYELGSWEDDGLETTGCFEGILIGEKTGTLAFTLLPDEKNGWECEYQHSEPLIDAGLVDKLVEIVNEIKEGKLVS